MVPELDKLAQKLEWVFTRFSYCKVFNGVEVRCRSIIEFAAYAKAEMADRYWYADPTDRTFRLFYSNPDGSTGDYITDNYSFDPTDPLSEAKAIIKACLEALQLEGEQA